MAGIENSETISFDLTKGDSTGIGCPDGEDLFTHFLTHLVPSTAIPVDAMKELKRKVRFAFLVLRHVGGGALSW